MKTYYASVVLSVFSMAVLISFAARSDTITKAAKKGTVLTAVLIALCAISECLGEILNGASPAFRPLHITVKVIELSVAPLIPVTFATAFYPIRSRKILFGILGAHALIEFLSAFLGITFSVDGQNVYHHGTLYPLYYAMIAISACFLIYTVVRFNTKFQNCNLYALSMIGIFVLAGVVMQAVDPTVRIVWLTIAVGMILFYIYYCSVILHTDGLTGLLNRRSFDAAVATNAKPVAVIMIDVNAFKFVNDTYGHRYGDRCLTTIGTTLKEAYGKDGLCFRFGGDEFCVILRKHVYAVDALNKAFLEKLAEKRGADENLPTVAIGYGHYIPQQNTLAEAIEQADRDMYQNKNAGKPRSAEPDAD